MHLEARMPRAMHPARAFRIIAQRVLPMETESEELPWRLWRVDINKPFATVISNDRITPGFGRGHPKHRHRADAEDFSYHVGDSIGLLVPGRTVGNEYHSALHTIAGGEDIGNKTRLTLCIKRCFYIDDYGGEKYEQSLELLLRPRAGRQAHHGRAVQGRLHDSR